MGQRAILAINVISAVPGGCVVASMVVGIAHRDIHRDPREQVLACIVTVFPEDVQHVG